MIMNMIGGGEASLNYKVVGGATQPTSPTENMIWVNTDAAITSHVFSFTQPENPVEGACWIQIWTVSNTPFNALKKNGIMVYPIKAFQYVGGEWVNKAAETYQNGTWSDWFLYLYKDSAINNEIVGALTAYNYRPSTSSSTATKPDVALNSSGITVSLPNSDTGTAGSYFATKGIDLTAYKTLKIHVETATTNYSSGHVRFGVTDSRTNNYTPIESRDVCSGASGSVSDKTFSLDISNLSGGYYLFVNLYGGGAKSIRFTKWWLEP